MLDDYHEIAEEARAEDFVRALVALCPVSVLVASRVRPAWVSTKDLLYGVVCELSQSALAMDASEAIEVLAERGSQSVSGLVQLANGWPAVIGLASVASSDPAANVARVPESLYHFFADEVFNALGPGIRQGLTTLAAAPLLDYELATVLLGRDSVEEVTSAALDAGLLVEREQRLDLHPLARAFLEERSAQLGLVAADGSSERLLAAYLCGREWDAAFELIVRTGAMDELDSLMRHALDELLATARLSTVHRWCLVAGDSGVSTPIIALARAERLLRHGEYVETVAHAQAAAAHEPELAFRSLSVAGRAAHLASREEEALGLYRRAEAAATAESEARDARWGQLLCVIDLELESSEAQLTELSETVDVSDAREMVRAATNRLYFQLRQGAIDLDSADVAYQLLGAVDDPLVESSFLCGYANALSLAARYDDGLEVSEALSQIVERLRFDFAIPYVQCARAMAFAGNRRWRDAELAATAALDRARASRDGHASLLACSVLLRLFAQCGRLDDALRLKIGSTRDALKGAIGEVLGSRALAMACTGRSADALDLIDEIDGSTTAVEPTVLIPAVRAICAVRDSSSDVVELTRELAGVAFATGAVDLLITTYRACPELLAVLLRVTSGRHFRELVEGVGDADLAQAVGFPIAVNEDRRLLLSRRETDVYELLRSGLTNKQIGRLLFIEESTVKAHTNRIYGKLGVHSRSALAVQAALERSDQATSAIDETSSGAEPS